MLLRSMVAHDVKKSNCEHVKKTFKNLKYYLLKENMLSIGDNIMVFASRNVETSRCKRVER